MANKHIGICPFCKADTAAEIIEENDFRRDMCRCTECEKTIYVCRTPGCDDYARGGSSYDDELCPQCTKNITLALTGGIFMLLLGRLS